MWCEAKQRKVGVFGFGITPASTCQKNLLARSIPGRLMVVFHHARYQRTDEATNQSKMNGSIARNTGAGSAKDHHDGSEASVPADNHMRNTMAKEGARDECQRSQEGNLPPLHSNHAQQLRVPLMFATCCIYLPITACRAVCQPNRDSMT